ncbi:MAG: glycosyl transferase, partial [Hyphomicrobium sp.]
EQPEVIQHWIALRQKQCKWPVIEGWDHVPAKALLAGISPLSTAVMLDDPMFALARTYRYGRDSIAVPAAEPPSFEARRRRKEKRKLKIGYVSSDLREHAVGFGIAEVMELHDKERFAIHAYYCGIPRVDPTRERIQAAVDSWVDISKMTDDEAAKHILDDEIDILIDLNGFTRDARTAVFARRPAPIIVNWFGFPATMGSPYHNYIIADPYIIPDGDEIYFSEKVLRLPCYQPNDRKRPVAEHKPTRAEQGLPDDAFVFCCLNGSQKNMPAIFQIWMHILAQVPNSVLWLLSSTADTNERLRAMAVNCGVAPERLVFAEKEPNPQHLARYRLADVFLDTYPYGAHTTAADALWMGVPVLTIPGRSFASRVCADLVQAAGQPDLVCSSPADYAAKAIAFANDRGKLAAIRAALDAGRSTSLLFDTPRLVLSLEDLFSVMWSEFEHGRLPVPDLTNLDAYVEIGVDLNLNRDAAAGADYRERWEERLRVWNRSYRLHADGRFWSGEPGESNIDRQRLKRVI